VANISTDFVHIFDEQYFSFLTSKILILVFSNLNPNSKLLKLNIASYLVSINCSKAQGAKVTFSQPSVASVAPRHSA
jgi:hypothetical protein